MIDSIHQRIHVKLLLTLLVTLGLDSQNLLGELKVATSHKYTPQWLLGSCLDVVLLHGKLHLVVSLLLCSTIRAEFESQMAEPLHWYMGTIWKLFVQPAPFCAAAAQTSCLASDRSVHFFVAAMIAGCARQTLSQAVRRGVIAPCYAPLLSQQRWLHQSSPRFNVACTPGVPVMFTTIYDKPGYDDYLELEWDEMPRDEFGVPAHIPPELSTTIRHTYYIPPQYFPFLKKLGDDTPELKPWMDKLMNGEMTFDDYEEMFYQFAKPLKIHRPLIPMPYRNLTANHASTPSMWEMKKSPEMLWEGAWLSFRQRVLGDYTSRHYFRDFIGGMGVGVFLAWAARRHVFASGPKTVPVKATFFVWAEWGGAITSFFS
eukprot:s603_g9.t1